MSVDGSMRRVDSLAFLSSNRSPACWAAHHTRRGSVVAPLAAPAIVLADVVYKRVRAGR